MISQHAATGKKGVLPPFLFLQFFMHFDAKEQGGGVRQLCVAYDGCISPVISGVPRKPMCGAHKMGSSVCCSQMILLSSEQKKAQFDLSTIWRMVDKHDS